MLSVKTNLGSDKVQSCLVNSTTGLNQAIRRMTTGYKINQAKDDAANFSISTNMSGEISSYQTAEANASMGIDLVRTANDALSNMQSISSRLLALSTQARNCTYGSDSLNAINAEANAHILELVRLYKTTEYNSKKLFSSDETNNGTRTLQPGSSGFIDTSAMPNKLEAGASEFIDTSAMPNKLKAGASEFIDTSAMPNKLKAGASGFIDESFTRIDTSAMKTLAAAVADGETIKGGTWAIGSVEDLEKLAEITNQTTDYTSGTTFVLAKDLNLSGISSWTQIGSGYQSSGDDYYFQGTFEGNGYKISNLAITTTGNYKGLFGKCNNAKICNLGLENVSIVAGIASGSLVGSSLYSEITNCYATGNIDGESELGGLIGSAPRSTTISKCYADVDITGDGYGIFGGLIGGISEDSSRVSKSYARGNVKGTKEVGGLVGRANNVDILNCYATGNVEGDSNYVGGLVGSNSGGSVTNCYATGYVKGQLMYTGGLVGVASNITNCYATGKVDGKQSVGGLAGAGSNITNCYAIGNVTGARCVNQAAVGGLVGELSGTLNNSYALGNVIGYLRTGGLVGEGFHCVITNCYAKGNVTENSTVAGALIGCASDMTITKCYATGNVNGIGDFIGGFVGECEDNSTITNSYSNGSVTGRNEVGGFVGRCWRDSKIINSYATGSVDGKEYVGGFVGSKSGSSVTNCYATGIVEGEKEVGGFVGRFEGGTISNSYASGDVIGESLVGGLAGKIQVTDDSAEPAILKNNISMGNVTGNDGVGTFIGGIHNTGADKSSYGTIDIINCFAPADTTYIGGTYFYNYGYIPYDYDMTDWLNGISGYVPNMSGGISKLQLQVGTNSAESSHLIFNTNFAFDFDSLKGGIDKESTYQNIERLLGILNSQQAQLGSVGNRLESALDEIKIKVDNMTSTRSTLRDADITIESSAYIRNQILQQASATLFSTANQTPNIAMQLL